MIVNVQKLRGKLSEKSVTQETVADSMGIDRTTFYRKMKNGGSGFTIGEIHKMTDVIPLSRDEAVDIFFTR